MKATELLAKLFDKAGIDTTDEKLKDILAVQVEIPDEFANKLDTELMDKKAAKSLFKNENINEFTTGVYINIEKDLESLGLSKDERDEVFKEKSLGKVVKAYASKIKEVTEKANPPNSDKEKTLRDEVKALNLAIADYKDKFVPKEEIDKVRTEWDADKFDREIEKSFLAKPWSKNYPADMRPDLAKIALNKKLAELGAKAVMNGKEVRIVKADDIHADYFDKSNKLITFASLADDIMSTNKFLELSPEVTSTNTTVTANSSGQTNSKKLNTTQSLVKDLLNQQQSE